MTEVSFLILGLIVGGIIAYFWARAQTKSALTNQINEIEIKARSAENIITEFINQLQ